ncbi:MAG: 6-hydroxynicotinate reductase [Burkholderia sp.]|nr:6-hydroxynicotinate reductase [Burkholderia sp.]
MLQGARPRNERLAANKIESNAYPVLCQINEGRTGVCYRYANEGGALVRVDPVLLMQGAPAPIAERQVVPLLSASSGPSSEEEWPSRPHSVEWRFTQRVEGLRHWRGVFDSDGRWHFQHGPMDLIIGGDGAQNALERAHEAAWARFAPLLGDDELPLLRHPIKDGCPLNLGGGRCD